MRCRSFAKINRHLQVVGRRADGYHELRTLFQTISLADRLEIELVDQPGIRLEVHGAALDAGPTNLAQRAASGFLERWAPARGVALRLEKRIPLGGGLGGGSSNAATVLWALQELLGAPAPASELWALARELGADVPFFLLGGSALGFGRGDELGALPDLPEEELWLAIPPVAVPTARVFAALGGLTGEPLAFSILRLAQGEPAAAPGPLTGRNDLEAAVMQLYPEIAAAKADLESAGASEVRLSGSGATLVARFAPDRPPTRSDVPAGCRLERVRTLTRAARRAGRRSE